jgi:hypothetical protein
MLTGISTRSRVLRRVVLLVNTSMADALQTARTLFILHRSDIHRILRQSLWQIRAPAGDDEGNRKPSTIAPRAQYGMNGDQPVESDSLCAHWNSGTLA